MFINVSSFAYFAIKTYLYMIWTFSSAYKPAGCTSEFYKVVSIYESRTKL